MKRAVALGTAVASVALLVSLTGAPGQKLQVLHGSIVDIYAAEVVVDWMTGVATLTGKVRVEIKGDYDANMTAPKVTATTSQEKNQVLSLEAQGPVTIDVVTKTPEGKQWRVSARCSDSATFSEQTMIAVLKGNAHAEATGLPRLEEMESAEYDGDTMTVDLKKHLLTFTQAHINAEMAPQAPSPEAGAKH